MCECNASHRIEPLYNLFIFIFILRVIKIYIGHQGRCCLCVCVRAHAGCKKVQRRWSDQEKEKVFSVRSRRMAADGMFDVMHSFYWCAWCGSTKSDGSVTFFTSGQMNGIRMDSIRICRRCKLPDCGDWSCIGLWAGCLSSDQTEIDAYCVSFFNWFLLVDRDEWACLRSYKWNRPLRPLWNDFIKIWKSAHLKSKQEKKSSSRQVNKETTISRSISQVVMYGRGLHQAKISTRKMKWNEIQRHEGVEGELVQKKSTKRAQSARI